MSALLDALCIYGIGRDIVLISIFVAQEIEDFSVEDVEPRNYVPIALGLLVL